MKNNYKSGISGNLNVLVIKNEWKKVTGQLG